MKQLFENEDIKKMEIIYIGPKCVTLYCPQIQTNVHISIEEWNRANSGIRGYWLISSRLYNDEIMGQREIFFLNRMAMVFPKVKLE